METRMGNCVCIVGRKRRIPAEPFHKLNLSLVTVLTVAQLILFIKSGRISEPTGLVFCSN